MGGGNSEAAAIPLGASLCAVRVPNRVPDSVAGAGFAGVGVAAARSRATAWPAAAWTAGRRGGAPRCVTSGALLAPAGLRRVPARERRAAGPIADVVAARHGLLEVALCELGGELAGLGVVAAGGQVA